jgi:hypothetical protein
MNTPIPLIRDGLTPFRGKSSFFFKVLLILAIHVVIIGVMLLQGCKVTVTNPRTPQVGQKVQVTIRS